MKLNPDRVPQVPCGGMEGITCAVVHGTPPAQHAV